MTQSALIQNLQQASLYPHPVQGFQLIETHISWLLLTGSVVYKIKKPLNLEFLDFSTLDKRQHFCEEEIRLNSAFAPELYLGVVAITGSITHPQLNGDGPVIEYAVKMREFPQTNLFDHLLNTQQLPIALMDKVAIRMAKLHAAALPGLANNPYGTCAQVHEPVVQNFQQIRPLLDTEPDLQQLEHLETWANQEHQRLAPIFIERKSQGFIRACHGDAHLGNIVLIDDQPTFFDCIEFNDSIRWTDVMADVGFLCMDLEDHGHVEYAHRFLNQYLQYSGDYAGLEVLNYYKAYRAMVRAKVALFQRLQTSDPQARLALQHSYRHCTQLAQQYTQNTAACCLITHGVAASGKSYMARILVEKLGCIQLVADIERKRLSGLPPTANTHAGVKQGLYEPTMTDNTYAELARLASIVLHAGYRVIVDASFIAMKHRAQFAALAAQHHVLFLILSTTAPIEVLQQRLQQRLSKAERISDAYPEVLAMQLATQEPLSAEEEARTLQLGSNNTAIINAIDTILDKLTRP